MPLRQYLASLEAAGLVRLAETKPELEYLFSHALIREAAYASLVRADRQRLHALVAEALEQIHAGRLGEQAPTLAFHYRQAANWPKALEFARQAGQQAQDRNAPHEAVAYLSQAIEAADRSAQPPDRALLRRRGRAYETIGEFELARADYEQSLALARAAAPAAAPAEWQALVDLGQAWAGHDYARTGAYFQEALERARAAGDPLTIAHSLNRVGNWLVNTGRLADGLEQHRQALETFRKLGSRAEIAATYNMLALIAITLGDLRSAQEQVEWAIALFRQTDDKQGLVESVGTYISLVSDCDTLPRPRLALPAYREQAAEALVLARQLGWLAGQVEIHWGMALVLAAFGQLGEALERANLARQLASEIEHREWTVAALCTLGLISILLLEPDAAAGHLALAQQLAIELSSVWWTSFTSVYLAWAEAQRQHAPAAMAALERAAAALGMAAGWQSQPARNLFERLVVWAWSEAALASGQPAEALAATNRLLATAINPDGQPIPTLLRLKAEALMALDRPAEAQAPLALALAGAHEQQAQPVLWQIHRDRGRLAQRLGRPDEAAHEFEAARAVVEGLAATLPDEPDRRGFLSRAAAQII